MPEHGICRCRGCGAWTDSTLCGPCAVALVGGEEVAPWLTTAA